MAEPTDRPNPQRTASMSSEAASSNSKMAQDLAIDHALEAELNRSANEAKPEVSLKRQWDSEMEAELEAALAGFDPRNFDVGARQRDRGERAQVGKRDRGQEARKGTRTGKVIGLRGKSLFVDLGGKSEGVVPLDQFEGELPKPGEDIEVIVDHFDVSEGIQHLRLKGSAVEASWENLRKGIIVEAKVTKVIKGGVEVDVDGIRGFMPISQIDLSRVEDGGAFLNQKLKAIVTEANQREKNLVISRRELLEQERAELREKTWAILEEGQSHEGTVRSVKDFGAFVDIGGVDGLLPIGEMSWSRVQKVDDLVKIGDKVTVKVLKIDTVARKLTLGLKQLTPSPWESVEAKYPRGGMVRGSVTKLMEFGAFVELEPGIEGLIHVTELSPTRVRRIADIVTPGQEVEVRILKVEPEVRRIALSLLPAVKATKPTVEDVVMGGETEVEEPLPPPKPVRKVPLRGGLGDRDRAK